MPKREKHVPHLIYDDGYVQPYHFVGEYIQQMFDEEFHVLEKKSLRQINPVPLLEQNI